MNEGRSETDARDAAAGGAGGRDDIADGGSADDEPFDLPAVLSRLDDPDPATQREALADVRRAVETDPAKCVATVPKLRTLLGRPSISFHDRIVYCLAEMAAECPDDVAPSTDAIVDFAASTSSDRARSEAFRCLANVAERRPESVVDHVERVAGVLESDRDEWGVYVLSCLSREYPAAAAPAKPALIDALAADPDTFGSAATATLGRIVEAEPTTSVEFVDRVVPLVDHDDPATRNNAIGCLGDVADRNPAAVENACPSVATALESDDPNTRANAAITLARVAAGSPDAVRAITGQLWSGLEDEFAPVRRHACIALGQARVAAARDRLEALAADDPDPAVRERASWAVDRIADR